MSDNAIEALQSELPKGLTLVKLYRHSEYPDKHFVGTVFQSFDYACPYQICLFSDTKMGTFEECEEYCEPLIIRYKELNNSL